MIGPEKILDIASRLYDAALINGEWQAALSEIECSVKANNVHLLVSDPKTRLPNFGVVCRHTEANVEYIRDYAPFDERYPRILKLPHGRPTRQEDLTTEAEMLASRLHNEFLKKYDAQSQVITRMDGPESGSVIFSAVRREARGPFDNGEIGTIRRLLPHVLRAVQIRQALASIEAIHQPLLRLMECLRV